MYSVSVSICSITVYIAIGIGNGFYSGPYLAAKHSSNFSFVILKRQIAKSKKKVKSYDFAARPYLDTLKGGGGLHMKMTNLPRVKGMPISFCLPQDLSLLLVSY